jgi:hypothetical protein
VVSVSYSLSVLTPTAIEAAASVVETAGDRVRRAFTTGQIQTEDDFTSRLVDRIEGAFNGKSIGGFAWSAMKLTDRGKGAQESEFGADLLCVLSVTTPRGHLAKGFLVQAKLAEPGEWSNTKKLRTQCEDMLLHTPDSFVFRYEESGIDVFSALAVARMKVSLRRLPRWPLRTFFVAHLSSFIGDESLSVALPATLDDLREFSMARRVLRLSAEPDSQQPLTER